MGILVAGDACGDGEVSAMVADVVGWPRLRGGGRWVCMFFFLWWWTMLVKW